MDKLKKHTRRLRLFLILFVFLFCFIKSHAQDVCLSFLGQTQQSFRYPISVSSSVSVSTSTGETYTLNQGTAYLIIPKNILNICFTFDKPENIISLDLSWNYSEMGSAFSKLTQISIKHLDNLQRLLLESNSLTTIPAGDIPNSCTIAYGKQEPLELEVLLGNLIELADYDDSAWKVEWQYYSSGTNVPQNTFEKYSNGTYHCLNNISSALKLILTHRTGLTLESKPLFFNKNLLPLINFTTDGRGTATSFSFQSNQTVTETMIAECEGNIAEPPAWNVSFDIPNLKNSSREITVNVNMPEVISSFFLNNLGISELSFLSPLPYLYSIELKGNSIMPHSIPKELYKCEIVRFGEQNPFVLIPKESNMQYDLSSEVEAGALVEWESSDGTTIGTDAFTVTNGIYTFSTPIGKARARLTLPDFPDYSIYSEYTDISLEYSPFVNIAWAKESIEPAVVAIECRKDIHIQINSVDFPISAGVNHLRLDGNSGTALISTTDNSQIKSVSFANIGLYKVDFTNISDVSIESLDLTGNLFTPFNLPVNLPLCPIEWGTPPIIDISDNVVGDTSVDMYDYRNFNIKWFYLSGTEVSEDSYSEITGFYKFDNIGDIYAEITVDGYEGLTFKTSVVTLVGEPHFEKIIEFVSLSDQQLQATITLSAGCLLKADNEIFEFETDGEYPFYFTGIGTYSNQNVTHSIEITEPVKVTEINLSGCAISTIDISDKLDNIIKIDLSSNNLTYQTFPRLDNVMLILDNQAPTHVEVNEDGVIYFPDFKDCDKIVLLSANGLPVSESNYEISDGNDSMTLNSSVVGAYIEFSNHPLFPVVVLHSIPFTYIMSSSIEDITDECDIRINGATVTLNCDEEGNIYNLQGQLIRRLGSHQSVTLSKGFYILILSNGLTKKILI